MKVLLLGLVGLFLGALAGGVIGVGAGMVWINVFNTSDFEGYAGMLVFYTFMPLGILAGGLAWAYRSMRMQTGAGGLTPASPASFDARQRRSPRMRM